MRRHLITALLYTIVTTVLFGVVYPFVVTGLAQVLFHDKANGQLLYKDGELEIVPITVKEILDKSGHEVVRG